MTVANALRERARRKYSPCCSRLGGSILSATDILKTTRDLATLVPLSCGVSIFYLSDSYPFGIALQVGIVRDPLGNQWSPRLSTIPTLSLVIGLTQIEVISRSRLNPVLLAFKYRYGDQLDATKVFESDPVRNGFIVPRC